MGHRDLQGIQPEDDTTTTSSPTITKSSKSEKCKGQEDKTMSKKTKSCKKEEEDAKKNSKSSKSEKCKDQEGMTNSKKTKSCKEENEGPRTGRTEFVVENIAENADGELVMIGQMEEVEGDYISSSSLKGLYSIHNFSSSHLFLYAFISNALFN